MHRIPIPSSETSELHPRNKHHGRYDFEQLTKENPELAKFIRLNAYQDNSIDFANPAAVKALNKALLKHYYAIANWDIPAQYLCPPIPGRADYLHYAADLLASTNGGIVPTGAHIHVLDIGVGANAVYPLIGQHEYGWNFVGSDIAPVAIANAQKIVNSNPGLEKFINLRIQTSPLAIFNGIVKQDDKFDLTLCNPPFHASLNDAHAGTHRKLRNLGKASASNTPKHKGRENNKTPTLNFGGQAAELYCDGGEEAFVNRMIQESKLIGKQCLWFSTLISKTSNLPGVYRAIKKTGANDIKTFDMAQGQKKSRFVAWTFHNPNQQAEWRSRYWLK